jgi:hypothetical protein
MFSALGFTFAYISNIHIIMVFYDELCSEWKVDIDIGRVCRRVGIRLVIVQANRKHGREVPSTGSRERKNSRWTVM